MARTSGSIGEKTAAAVREAAIRLFASKGYAAVSMRQIAAEVGVQVGTLYNHTPDKQSLLFDLMEQHMTSLLAAWAEEADDTEPAPEALDRFCRFHMRYHLARADAVFIAYMELRNLEPANFSKIEGLRGQYETALGDILTRGSAGGCFDISDRRLTTMAIIALLTGVTTWYRPGGRLAPEAIENQYITMVRRMVAAPAAG